MGSSPVGPDGGDSDRDHHLRPGHPGQRRRGCCTNAGNDALVDPDVLAHHEPVADPVVDHSDHDGHLDRDHRTRAAAGHRNLDAATSPSPLVAKQFAPVTAHTALLSRKPSPAYAAHFAINGSQVRASFVAVTPGAMSL